MGRYWLIKSDPETFGIRELASSPDRTTMWDGVRNYQARNHLRDDVRLGDRVLFHHSRCSPPAVVGTARITRPGYPDPTQFDPASDGHDPKSDPADARWYAVDVRLETEFPCPISLSEIRATPGLERMALIKSSRLSVQPVRPEEWRIILRLGRRG